VLIIARHGRTIANASGLLQGRVDNPLDDLGERQAAAIARSIGTPDKLISSPLLRARQTAAAFNIDVEIDDRWVELDYGDWDERPVADVTAAEWSAWRADPSYSPPRGESLAALNERVSAACHDLVEVARDGLVVVVCHVSPIKAAMRWALGVDAEVSWRLHVAQASISRVVVRGTSVAIASFNETHHLDGL
jgi:broad specificity phosphatase PhoE